MAQDIVNYNPGHHGVGTGHKVLLPINHNHYNFRDNRNYFKFSNLCVPICRVGVQ